MAKDAGREPTAVVDFRYCKLQTGHWYIAAPGRAWFLISDF
jgi:hypothetical protein